MYRIIVKNVTCGYELLWWHIKIKKSLDNICHTLEMELSPSERTKVHTHDKITVRYEDSIVCEPYGLVTTVFVDEITIRADVSKYSVTVIGRSPARDIIDSTWGETYINSTLFQITKYIANKFGFTCYCLPNPTPTRDELYDSSSSVKIDCFSWNNESPWTKLITEAARQGFILTSSQRGDLYIWKPEAQVREKESFFLTEGKNIKSIEWTENGAEQYHKYEVNGCFAEPIQETDNTCNNERVLTFGIDNYFYNPDAQKKIAINEMNRRKEKRITVTVPGWGLANEHIKKYLGTNLDGVEILWTPNLLIPVSIPSLNFKHDLLIAEVEQEASAKTMSSTITLVKRDVYLYKK